jgi:hypothetical protein
MLVGTDLADQMAAIVMSLLQSAGDSGPGLLRFE